MPASLQNNGLRSQHVFLLELNRPAIWGLVLVPMRPKVPGKECPHRRLACPKATRPPNTNVQMCPRGGAWVRLLNKALVRLVDAQLDQGIPQYQHKVADLCCLFKRSQAGHNKRFHRHMLGKLEVDIRRIQVSEATLTEAIGAMEGPVPQHGWRACAHAIGQVLTLAAWPAKWSCCWAPLVDGLLSSLASKMVLLLGSPCSVDGLHSRLQTYCAKKDLKLKTNDSHTG